MVRLKEPIINYLYARCNISIPYGAIKSKCTTKLMPPITSISIPYGAIKRMPQLQ